MGTLSKLRSTILALILSAGGVFAMVRNDTVSPGETVFVPVHPLRTVTVIFSAPITSLEGAGFTMAPEQFMEDFLLAWQEGSHFFSVTPLLEEGEMTARNLNVVMGRGLFTVQFFTVDDPLDALTGVVVTVRSEADARRQQEAERQQRIDSQAAGSMKAWPRDSFEVQVRDRPAVRQMESLNASRIVSFLDLTKLLTTLTRGHIQAMMQQLPGISVALRDDVIDYGDVSFHLHRVVRHERNDLMGFSFTIRNEGSRAILLNDKAFSVRVGDMVYQQLVSDLPSNILHPEDPILGFFLIIGDGTGGRNNLDVSNAFVIGFEEILNDE
jgi:hypothetical protein